MKPIAKIVSVSAARPDAAAIARAAQIIRQGGVVVFPTHGLYGLGADPFNPAAVDRIFAIKDRPAVKALLILIAEMRFLEQVALPPSAAALELMHHFWPGRITLVLHARKGLPAALTGSGAKIGVRFVAHPVAAALVRAVFLRKALNLEKAISIDGVDGSCSRRRDAPCWGVIVPI